MKDNRKPWTIDEEKLLRDNYPYFLLKDVAKLFPNRCGNGVSDKAREMGLRNDLRSVRGRHRTGTIKTYINGKLYAEKPYRDKQYRSRIISETLKSIKNLEVNSIWFDLIPSH